MSDSKPSAPPDDPPGYWSIGGIIPPNGVAIESVQWIEDHLSQLTTGGPNDREIGQNNNNNNNNNKKNTSTKALESIIKPTFTITSTPSTLPVSVTVSSSPISSSNCLPSRGPRNIRQGFFRNESQANLSASAASVPTDSPKPSTEADCLKIIKERSKKDSHGNLGVFIKGDDKRPFMMNGLKYADIGGPIRINIDDKTLGGTIFISLFEKYRKYRHIYDTDENELRIQYYQVKDQNIVCDNNADSAKREMSANLCTLACYYNPRAPWINYPTHERRLTLVATILWYGCFSEEEKISFLRGVIDSII